VTDIDPGRRAYEAGPESDAALEAEERPAALPVPVAPASGDLATSDTLSRYFAEIGRYPLLSRDEEKALAIRVFEDEDQEAAHTLVLSNLRLVVKIALDYRRFWTNLLDLIQEGTIGLLEAVRRFDPYRGTKLSTYSAYWIRAYLLKYLIDNIRQVRVGSSRAERKLFFTLNRIKRQLEREGLAPEPALLAERLELEAEDIERFEERMAQGEASLDAPLTREPDAGKLGDLVSAPGESVEKLVSDRDMHATFRMHIDKFSRELGERELRILRERVLADEPKTLQELGDEFKLTRERVRQLEKQLVDRLREYLQQNLVDFDYWAPDES
jgi:RNA polymerase sigma-32 factor